MEDIPPDQMRRQKCVVFPVNVSGNMNNNMPYLPDYKEIDIDMVRHGVTTRGNFYEHVLNGSWKGYRVLPCDSGGWIDSDDSEMEDEDRPSAEHGQVDEFLRDLPTETNADEISCFGCRINHMSQTQHMGPGGCLAPDNDAFDAADPGVEFPTQQLPEDFDQQSNVSMDLDSGAFGGGL
jgi:hypothetical protein